MNDNAVGGTARTATAGTLRTQVAEALQQHLPKTVEATVAAVMESSPAYARLFTLPRGEEMRHQIEIALGTFLRMAKQPPGAPRGAADALREPALEAAFIMGRNEAVSGRGTETLLTAFRVGARTSWHEFAAVATARGMPAHEVADFAELLFDFIDELSAATVAGHQHQTSRVLHLREQERSLLVRDLIQGARPTPERFIRARWSEPESTTVILTREADLHRVRTRLPAASLTAVPDTSASPSLASHGVALVPDLAPTPRARLLDRLDGYDCVVGPTVGIGDTLRSYRWATMLWERHLEDQPAADRAIDADEHLVDIVLAAEPMAVQALRARHLSPLDSLPPQTRGRLETTLGSWLAHRGRHDKVAADLFVHSQTVRYRIGQLQDLLGDKLHEPELALALHLALSERAHRVPE